MKTINDIDSIYEKLEGTPILKQERHIGGAKTYNCPVCDAPYKTEKGAKSHMEKASCVDMKSIYTGTSIEYHGFGLYKTVTAHFTPNARVSFPSFSKGKMYTPIMKLMTIIRYYGLYQHLNDYIGFITSKYKPKYASQVLSYAIKPANIDEFKVVMHGLDLINGSIFIEREYDNMKKDPKYFLRSLERCKFGVMDIARSNELSSLVDSLAEFPEYQERFYELIGRVSDYQTGRTV